MTPERASEVVGLWVRFYTRRLPAPIAQRRVEELGCDLHEQILHERAWGASESLIALSILSRAIRGMPADLAWRRRVQPSRGDLVKPFVALLFAALGVAAVAFVADSPGLLLASVLMIMGASVGAFAIGVTTARQRGFVLPYVVVLAGALGIAAIAVTSIVVGMRADAPGLVLLGSVLIASVIVGVFSFAMRTAQRNS